MWEFDPLSLRQICGEVAEWQGARLLNEYGRKSCAGSPIAKQSATSVEDAKPLGSKQPKGCFDSPCLLRQFSVEASLMVKPQVVTLVDAGSSPVLHPNIRL